MASILAIPPRINLNDLSQLSLQVPITEVTCLRNQLTEIDSENRAKVAQTLRAVAHLLVSGALVLLIAISYELRQQTNEGYSALLEQGRSERV
ncbi:hypothetical protein NC980_21500 [Leptolyngbya sp. AS-A5]